MILTYFESEKNREKSAGSAREEIVLFDLRDLVSVDLVGLGIIVLLAIAAIL